MLPNEALDGLVAKIAASGVAFATVKALSKNDLNLSSGVLVVKPPAALAYFVGEDVTPLTNGQISSQTMEFSVAVVAEDFGGDADDARSALAKLSALGDALTGEDVEGASGKGRIFYRGAVADQATASGVAMIMRLEVLSHRRAS